MHVLNANSKNKTIKYMSIVIAVLASAILGFISL